MVLCASPFDQCTILAGHNFEGYEIMVNVCGPNAYYTKGWIICTLINKIVDISIVVQILQLDNFEVTTVQ